MERRIVEVECVPGTEGECENPVAEKPEELGRQARMRRANTPPGACRAFHGQETERSDHNPPVLTTFQILSMKSSTFSLLCTKKGPYAGPFLILRRTLSFVLLVPLGRGSASAPTSLGFTARYS